MISGSYILTPWLSGERLELSEQQSAILDRLREGPMTTQELGEYTTVRPYQVCRNLKLRGFIIQAEEDGLYYLTREPGVERHCLDCGIKLTQYNPNRYCYMHADAREDAAQSILCDGTPAEGRNPFSPGSMRFLAWEELHAGRVLQCPEGQDPAIWRQTVFACRKKLTKDKRIVCTMGVYRLVNVDKM